MANNQPSPVSAIPAAKPSDLDSVTSLDEYRRRIIALGDALVALGETEHTPLDDTVSAIGNIIIDLSTEAEDLIGNVANNRSWQ